MPGRRNLYLRRIRGGAEVLDLKSYALKDKYTTAWPVRGKLALQPPDRLLSRMMNLTELTSGDLKNLVVLLERKEALQAEVAKINADLASFELGQLAAPARGKPGRKPSPAKLPRAAESVHDT